MQRAAGAFGMVGAVVKDARSAMDAGVDTAVRKPRLAPRVPASMAERDPPVLPVLVGQLFDAPADHGQILAPLVVARASIHLNPQRAAAARGALSLDVRASAPPDAPVVREQ